MRTNTARPPAVPVGELLDTIERTAPGAEVVVRHPLQPFDPRNFTPGSWAATRPGASTSVTLEGARAMDAPRLPPRPFLASPLPPKTDTVLELDDLVAFVRHPVRAFLRQRLGFGVATYADEVADALPIELDSLESWQVGQRMLDARLAGATADAAVAAERARGELPPGVLADPVIAKLLPDVEQIVQHAANLLPDPVAAGSVDVRVTLPDGRRLNGTVPDVHGYAAAERHLLAREPTPPARHLGALPRAHRRASRPRVRGGDRRPRGLPRAARDDGDGRAAAEDGAGAVALRHLASLAALFDDGMREPLPLACKTSAAYAAALHGGSDGVKAGAGAWESGWKFPARGRRARAHAGLRRHAGLRGAAREHRVRPPRATAVGRPARAGRRWRSRDRRVRRLRPAPDRRDRARGERGHRQDVHHRRAGRPLRGGRAFPLDQLLMVTFTRMATGELRERVRERLVSAERGLEGTPPEDDEVVRLLATGTPDEVRVRRERLAAALADFDSATIATTHGFCQEVLGGLGMLGDIESDTTFVEDVTDLREEVVDDLYVRRFARRGTPEFSRKEAMEIARTAIDNPAAPIEPATHPTTRSRRCACVSPMPPASSSRRASAAPG